MKIVGTAIIFDEQKRVLIGQRPDGKALAGLWEFPGGKQEQGETVEQCIVREIKEELNVNCVVGDFLLSVAKKYGHGDFKLMVYCAEINDVENMSAMVHNELRWVRVDELLSYKFPPADDEIIEYLIQHF